MAIQTKQIQISAEAWRELDKRAIANGSSYRAEADKAILGHVVAIKQGRPKKDGGQ